MIKVSGIIEVNSPHELSMALTRILTTQRIEVEGYRIAFRAGNFEEAHWELIDSSGKIVGNFKLSIDLAEYLWKELGN